MIYCHGDKSHPWLVETGSRNGYEKPYHDAQKPNTCELPYTDHLDGTQQLRYLTTCNPCPVKYPSIPSLDDQVEDTREKNRFGFLE